MATPWVRLAEQKSAVSSGRRPAGLGPFEEDDVAGASGGGVLCLVLCLVLFDGLEGGPQAGEAAADDDEVGGGVAAQRGLRVGQLDRVEPVRGGGGAGQGGGDVRVSLNCRHEYLRPSLGASPRRG